MTSCGRCLNTGKCCSDCDFFITLQSNLFTMKGILRYSLATLAVLASVSCGHKVQDNQIQHPFVERIVADTSSLGNKILSEAADSTDRYGSIAIIGEDFKVLRLADRLAVFDYYDNIDANAAPDSIPDFSGEVFEVLMDYANSPYEGYIDASNSMFLREINIRNTIQMLSDRCYANAYDEERLDSKMKAKAVILASTAYTPEVLHDIDFLFRTFGVDIPVFSLQESAVRDVFSSCKNITGVGVMADIAVAASGTYGELFRNMSSSSGYLSAVHNVIFSPEGTCASERLRNFIDMYIGAGYREQLNAIIVDDLFLASDIDSMYVALDEMVSEESERGLLYKSVIADNFRFVDPAYSVSKDLFIRLREENMLALRIDYPAYDYFVTVPSPDFIVNENEERDSFEDEFKYNRAYNSLNETYKLVRLSHRHIRNKNVSVFDSIAPNLKMNFWRTDGK